MDTKEYYMIQGWAYEYATNCLDEPNGNGVAQRRIDLANCGAQQITKADFDKHRYTAAYNRIKPLIDQRDISSIVGTLVNNDNKWSIKAASDIIGITLNKTMKVRMEQLKKYFGEYWEVYEANEAAKEAERIAKEAAEEAAELAKEYARLDKVAEELKGGQKINNKDFVALCDRYNVKLPIRTRGWALEALCLISTSSQVHNRGTRASSVIFNYVDELLKAVD